MGRYRIPDDSEVQALLDKERREQERRNQALLGKPNESMAEVHRRRELGMETSELDKDSSEELSTELGEQALANWPIERREAYIKAGWIKHGLRLCAILGLLALTILGKQWLIAIFAVVVLWGQYLGFAFWKGMPSEREACNEYIAKNNSDRTMGLYLSAMGGFLLILMVVAYLLAKFITM